MKGIGALVCAGLMLVQSVHATNLNSESGAREPRLALVIGNGAYKNAPLDNPVNDARDLAATLKTIGFEVLQKENLNALEMKKAIREFGDKLQANRGGVGLFFYAGHGVQVKGNNFLIPVGHDFRTENDIEDDAIDANTVLRRLEEAQNRINIVILDACRNNPFARTDRSRALTRGLARMEAPSGALIAFATAPGTEARDGSGKNGLYTKHLMSHIKTRGLTLEQVFKRTRAGVEAESGRQQSPREESSLKGDDFYFLPPASTQAMGADPALAEVSFWDSIKASAHSADYQAYLEQYPDGKFAGLARNHIARLQPTEKIPRSRGDQKINPTVSVKAPAHTTPDSDIQFAGKIEELGKMTHLRVNDLRSVVRQGLLTIQTEISNTSTSNQNLFYRFKWLDNSGFSVWEDEPWKPLTFYGKQKQSITVVAPSPKATDFRLVLQSPDNRAHGDGQGHR